jgi:hypothetical protein
MAVKLKKLTMKQTKTKIALELLIVVLFSSCAVLHVTPSKKNGTIEFTEEVANEKYNFIYQNSQNSPDLAKLKEFYRLDSIAGSGNAEFRRILNLLKWTNSRWEHSASNQPSKSNTLTILQEAETGEKFRCVEYGIVLRSVLASDNLPSRTLGLKTKDVEVTRFGAGHVLTEVWSSEFNKWFMLDGQFNVVPVLDNIPLSAVEFQRAIVQNKDYKLVDADGTISEDRKKNYMKFLPPYLFYFDFLFDQREIPYDSLYKVNDKGVLMLAPVGAKKPTVFQRKFELDFVEYTTNINDFYKKP